MTTADGAAPRRDRWIAPWTDEQVAALNALQADGRFHGYTCPGERECGKHGRMLSATRDGWVCNCGLYRQTWAHALAAGRAHPALAERETSDAE